MPVQNPCEEYNANLSRWTLVQDAVKGEAAIKAGRDLYLPLFLPHDEPRYKALLQRAVFTGYTARTLKGLTGAVFRKPPETELPPQVEYLSEDYDGSGESLDQLGKIVCDNLLQFGRIGLLVDHPSASEGLTKAQTDALNLRATIAPYPAVAVINWRAVKIGGALVLDMVTLKETASEAVDYFTMKETVQYRALMFDEARTYMQRIFDKDGNQIGQDIYPKKADGKPWKEIPFVFIGATDNRPSVDDAPLYDLAVLNVAHYRNSADYEEASHMHGQGTLFINPGEMSAETFSALNPNGITVGARRGHVLGNGGSAMLLQMEANGAAFEAMKDKVEQMKAIGARIVGLSRVQETAEAVKINASSETSTLKTIAGNASEGIEKALEFVCEFMGGDPEKATFTLNQDFFDQSMSPQEALVFLQLIDRGDIAQSDLRDRLRNTGWISGDRTDDLIDKEAEKAKDDGVGLEKKKILAKDAE